MDQKACKNVCIRMSVAVYEKLCAIAQQESRSASRQGLYWIRRAIEQYEQESAEKEK